MPTTFVGEPPSRQQGLDASRRAAQRRGRRSSAVRLGALTSALLLVVLAFAPTPARASPPFDTPNTNAALASNGGSAAASSYTAYREPTNAIDGSASTSWESGQGTAWLHANFSARSVIREVHIHMAGVPMPDFDVHGKRTPSGAFEVLLASVRGNTNLDVVAAFGETVLWGVQATFLTAVNHTHTYTHEHTRRSWECVAWDTGSGECVKYGWIEETYTETHSYTEQHYPAVAELEAYGYLDADADGLDDKVEETTIYMQEVGRNAWSGIPDDAANASSLAVSLVPWSGIGLNAYADFTVDHPSFSELTAAIGYWNGSAWVDRYVWDPAGRAPLPSVTVGAPAHAAGTVTLTATASAPLGMSRVEFYVGRTLVGTDPDTTDSSYSATWNTADGSWPDGTYTVTAIAIDGPGNARLVSTEVVVDNTVPQAQIVSPAAGATVGSTVTVTVDAADVNLDTVALKVDGTDLGAPTLDPNGDYLFSWNTLEYGSGAHTLTAEARDRAGNLKTHQISVTVSNGYTPPSASITSPAANSKVFGTVVYAASATDDYRVDRVEFFVDSTRIGTKYFEPYEISWNTNTVPDGSHELTVKAYDPSGNMGSASIWVVVGDDGGGGEPCEVKCIEPTGATASSTEPGYIILGTAPSSVLATGVWAIETGVTVSLDLRKSAFDLTTAERDAGILAPSFTFEEFHAQTSWRLVVKDWSPGNAGNVTHFAVTLFERSSTAMLDTDGDGLSDRDEYVTHQTFPVARDSDADRIEDPVELTPRSLSVAVEGIPTTLMAVVTDPTMADTDGDGLSDGQEFGVVPTGLSRIIGEVGTLDGVDSNWHHVDTMNDYTAPVVIAGPISRAEADHAHVRLRSVTGSGFDLRVEEWTSGASHGPESVAYLVLESGVYVLADGTRLEVGTVTAPWSATPVTFRQTFPSAPVVLASIQSASSAATVARVSDVSVAGFSAWSQGAVGSETVGYVALDPGRGSSGSVGFLAARAGPTPAQQWTTVSFDKFSEAAPLVLAWMDSYTTDGTRGLRLDPAAGTNASFRVWLEATGAFSETIGYALLSGSGNLTAPLTTDPRNPDVDGDTLKDGDEVYVHRSSPVFVDTDRDTFRDDVEVTNRTLSLTINGTATTRTVRTAPYTNDTDADGLLDQEEWNGTTAFRVVTDPSDPDTDRDGLADGQELYVATFRTPKRYPIPIAGSRSTDPVAVQVSGAAADLEGATLMTGVTHPDMGQLVLELGRASGGTTTWTTLRNREGIGQANNFTSYDLFDLGFTPSDLVASSTFTVRASDLVEWDAGQIEYAQILVTVRTSPVRYDTDSDGLNDSEELNLGFDGFATDPWKADTDGDGLADDEYFVKGTSPVLADTDRDGYDDRVDLVPLGDAFVTVEVRSLRPFGADDDGSSDLEPFVSLKIGNQTAYTASVSVAPGSSAALVHSFSANVPDDQDVRIAVQAWDRDADDTHERFEVAVGWEPDGYYGDIEWGLWHTLTAPGTRWYNSSGLNAFRLDPLTVTVTTVIPARIDSRLIVPSDFAGVVNVTDAQGGIVGRRYVGEPRFVALALNVSAYANYQCLLSGACDDTEKEPRLILVPRSGFYDTQLYRKLFEQDLAGLPSDLTFRQNSTTAAQNSDALQELITGNVTSSEYFALLDLLARNTTGDATYTVLNLTDDLFLFSLPDDALRLVAYAALPSTPSVLYRFCSTPNCGATPVAKPWWERVWEGLVATVTGWIASAVVFAYNAFATLAEILGQVGTWFGQLISGAGQAVASAVEAAGEVLNQVVGFLKDFLIGILKELVYPIFAPLIAPLREESFGLVASSSDSGVSSSTDEQARLNAAARLMFASAMIGGTILVVGAIIAGLINSNPLAAGVVTVALTVILASLFLAPVAVEVERGAAQATTYAGQIAGLTVAGLGSFLVGLGTTINGNILLIDAFAYWVAKLALAAEAQAVGPQGSLALAGAGWAMAIVALVLDALLIQSPSPTAALVAMGLSVAGIVLAVIGGATAFAVPYPLSLAGLFLNGLLGVFAFFGLAASMAHLASG